MAHKGYLIVNADDWGGWESATDSALACFDAGRITSVTAMVFMADSERAARIAAGTSLNVGLHLNFNQELTGEACPAHIRTAHDKIRKYLRRSKFSQLLFNPFLRRDFRAVFDAQLEEFRRIYQKDPTHFDGHQHMHLCANATFDGILPKGECVRRNFSFSAADKSPINRLYRGIIDRRLKRRHLMTAGFYSLEQCLAKNRLSDVVLLARSVPLELMTHPEKNSEFSFLMGDEWKSMINLARLSSYLELKATACAK